MQTTVTKPSELIGNIRLEAVDQWQLFKFNDALQDRMEILLDQKKADSLTAEECIELESIGELDRIFTHMNALLLAQSV
jgi:predicted transcriptional regulator